jgi:hypothetical protein
MQNNDSAEKQKIEVDGESLEGLVALNELTSEEATIEVPEYGKKRIISNGVKTIPPIEATFKIRRSSKTMKILSDWYLLDQVKDVTIITTDADGTEIKRTLYPDCECSMSTKSSSYDASSPSYAQEKIRLLPWDVINIPV